MKPISGTIEPEWNTNWKTGNRETVDGEVIWTNIGPEHAEQNDEPMLRQSM